MVEHAWVQQFRREHGRNPRVLHIGNVANNAYLNAKILRRHGVDSDVLCYDYYHIMSTPEWEDADFHQPVANEIQPCWHALDLNGFQCPPWFAQGPFELAVAYLRAQREGLPEAPALWHQLLLAGSRCPSPGAHGPLPWHGRMLQTANRMARRVVRGGSRRTRRLIRRLLFPDAALRRARELCAQFRMAFPERRDCLRPTDVWMPDLMPVMTALCGQYDFVAGYATDGIFPLLVDGMPYLAFEHGTLRNIPFQANRQGRICAITFRLADGVLITNADNQRSAVRLGLERYRFVPHAVNEDFQDLDQAAGLRDALCRELRASFLVFHPARQHWDRRRHPDWEKGNDHFIRGFAQYVKGQNPSAGAVFVEWGQMVAQSKELLRTLGIADRVKWIRPQPNQSLGRYIRACDALADQFHLGSFGNLMPKALLLGTPSLLYVDESVHRWCFAEMPPVLNARCPATVAEALRRLTAEPGLLDELRRRGRAWYARYHSNAVIADTWIDALASARDQFQARKGCVPQHPRGLERLAG